ncbi:hypothetical protein DFH28DRAFT_887805 [Melampsora americana]|nr:hypothetical protein DFH28DRAFT_887805 [Melampsora americana]
MKNELPLEIIDQILVEFIKRLKKEPQEDESTALEPYLTRTSYTELINLRLISKIWSTAVIPFYFQTISVDGSKRAKVIINNWNDDSFRPHFPCPVQRLTIESLWYPDPEQDDESDTSTDSNDPRRILFRKILAHNGSLRVSMDQLASLINSLGSSLRTLNLGFVDSMAVSPDVIEAFKTIKDLTSLNISFGCGNEAGTYDAASMSELLSVIPKLQYLSLQHIPDQLIIAPPHFSNLRYFSFHPHAEDIEGHSCITRSAKNTLKIIELMISFYRAEGLDRVFEPIKDTLEGLFTHTFTDQLIEDVAHMNFPNLRVIRTHYPPEQVGPELYWLQAPIVKNVRTIVTDLYYSEEYWKEALNLAGVNALKDVPNFKHIVFTKDEKFGITTISPRLIKAFQSHGVQCHVTDQLTAEEIMELDFKLNGPLM